ncbi:MAG: hypothetical protein L0Y66_21815 [Myxococcaceae bacterium]|nr:hypothetical protein [Myxococcaceae bacterium]
MCIVALAIGSAALAQTPQSRTVGKAPEAPRTEGGVNWAGPVLKATGSGAPDVRASSPAQARLGAEMAAKMDAFRNLLSQAKGIQVSAGRTLADEMQQDEVRGRVEGVIRGYKVTARRYYSDQGVELDVEVPLGALADAVAPVSSGKPATVGSEEASHSGVIVDASGLKVTPALAPRLLDETGKAVYSAEAVSADARKTQGVASYFASLEEAKKSPRVGAKPLVLKASRAQGSDLVLPADALERLKASNPRFLAEGRVAIVSN